MWTRNRGGVGDTKKESQPYPGGRYKRHQRSCPWLTRKASGGPFLCPERCSIQSKKQGLPKASQPAPHSQVMSPLDGPQAKRSLEKGNGGGPKLPKTDVRSGYGGLAIGYPAVCEVSGLLSELNGSLGSQRALVRSRCCILFLSGSQRPSISLHACTHTVPLVP